MWDKAAEITGSWITKWESKSVGQLWGQQCSNSTTQSVAQPINPPASQPTNQLFNWPISYINIQQDEGHRKVTRQLESADTTRRPMAIWKSGKHSGTHWNAEHSSMIWKQVFQPQNRIIFIMLFAVWFTFTSGAVKRGERLIACREWAERQ